MKNNKKYTIGWYIELAEEYEYPRIDELRKTLTISPFCKWAEEKGILKKLDWKDYEDRCTKSKGCKGAQEYRDLLAKKHGYTNDKVRRSEMCKLWRWETGQNLPKEFNDDCASWLGYIGENYVSKIFEDPVMMPYGNPGFDWICKSGQKIDHKGACITYLNGCQKFEYGIFYNNIADWFIISAWDNRDSLTPLYIWVFHKNDIVRGRKFWRRDGFTIFYSEKSIKKFKKYEDISRLEKLIQIINGQVI